jgi:putative oxidoreductase
MLSQYAASKHVPAPKLAVTGSGLLVFLGGLSILLGTWPHIGALLIAVFLVGVSPAMHNFWTITEPNQRMAETINFSKNMALLGAALMLMMISQPWVLGLGH